MRGFTEQELADFAVKRQRSAERLNQAVTDARRIARILNEVHGTGYSDDFWLFLVLPHLRKLQIQEYQDNLAIELGTADQSGDGQSFRSVIRQRLSMLLRTFTSFVRLFKQWVNFRRLSHDLDAHDIFVYGFHDVSEIRRKGHLISAASPVVLNGMQKHKRSLVQKHAASADCERLRHAMETLPPLLVERFESLLHCVPLHAPERKQFHVSIGLSDFMSLLFALYKEHGAEIHRYQHGSHYGEQENFDAIERLTSTAFHTWGWKIGGRDIPDRAYRLAGFGRRYKSHSDAQENDILVCYPALHRNNIEEVRQNSDGLLSELDRGKYPAVTARPRPMTRYFDHSADIHFAKKLGVQVDSGQNDIAQLIAKSRLVIHLRVPSTTFLECLYVDHPIMGVFFNHCPTLVALPHYEELFRMGLLHRSGEALCNYLNGIDSINSWWRDVTSNHAYQQIQNVFARRV